MRIHPQVDPGLINNTIPKIGILSPGKMGSSVVKSFAKTADFFTCLEGRSKQTIDNANACAVKILPSLEELFNNVDIFFCIGTKGIAKNSLQLAIKYQYKNIYVDLNTLFGRESEQEFYQLAEGKSFHFVDGAIYGWPPDINEKQEYFNKTDIYLFNDLDEIVFNLFKNNYWNPQKINTPAKTYRRVNLS